jgi:hypothetical protein
MSNNKEPLQITNEIVFYETEDGKISIAVRFEDENIWLTQKQLAELFEVNVRTVSEHLKNIFDNGELEKNSVIRKFRNTASDGKLYSTQFYNLEAIISVGYRVNSSRGIAFRTWATDKLRNYIFKGFAIDSQRFKKGSKFDARFFDELMEEIREIRASERMAYQKITDIYATAVDYSAKSDAACKFFANVQNKLHFAITGNTAAEIIKERADGDKPNMGLTSWRKAPDGKILPSDTTVAKNYLSKDELSQLNKIVNMYIDYAEFQAARGKVMTMKEWSEKLDAFLQFNEQEILCGFGHVSHEVAKALARKEYEKYRVTQDKSYQSDFDKLIAASKIKKSDSKGDG